MIPATILIVDDEPELLEILADQLSDRFQNIRTALDGRMALETAAQDPIDFVITDYRMPGMNGLTLLGEMRRKHPLVPALMLTGNDHEPDLLKALPLGGFDFLEKPFRFEILINRIMNGLLAARMARALRTLLKERDPAQVSAIEHLPWNEQLQELETLARNTRPTE